MSSAKAETIGPAKQPDALEAVDAPAEVTRAAESGEDSKTHGVADPIAKPPPPASRRPHPIFLLGLLLAVAGLALAFGNQFQRAQQLESQVTVLTGELSSARSQLASAQNDLAVYEQRMDGVRSAVADLSGRMSALQTLVNEPPTASTQP